MALYRRIILDTQGAEKLVGKGDMLYAPIGAGKPKRVQGCFVSDPEVEAVASYVKNNFTSAYDQQIMEEIERAAKKDQKVAAQEPEASADELDGDEMLPAALPAVQSAGCPSDWRASHSAATSGNASCPPSNKVRRTIPDTLRK